MLHARQPGHARVAAAIAGHDPQLEKAIAIVMDELKKNPPLKPKRPALPVR